MYTTSVFKLTAVGVLSIGELVVLYDIELGDSVV